VSGVLFLAESYHPVLGGGESHLRALARRLAEDGGRVTVVTRRSEPGFPAEETLEGVRVRRVPPSGPGRAGKYRMVAGALRALAREAPAHDVLVVRGTRVLGLPGLLAGRAALRPVVLQPEVNGELSGEVYTWGNALGRPPWRGLVASAVALRNRLLRDADAVVAMSRLIAAECRAAGIAEERVRHIPHGVDVGRFAPATLAERDALRRAHGLPEGAVIIIYTGRLLRGKGLQDLVEAVAAVAASDPAVHLLLVGAGEGQSLSVEDALRARARQPDLAGRVTFAGRVDDVAPWLRAADVFAFPSVFEALGLSLVEAAACGLPAVGSRTGGIVDVIEDGRSGLLFPPGDRPALEQALRVLVADAGRRAAYGAAARAVAASRFDARASHERYRALFAELARRRAPAA
jgi:glycosyltransferase involved in cell wall biosynthesis